MYNDKPVRSAYVIKTLYWGRYHDMYGDDWVDLESIAHKDSLCEAIAYAKEQCKQLRTIESKVFSNIAHEIMYKTEGKDQTLDQCG